MGYVRGPQTTRGIIISKGLLSCKQLFDQYP